MTSSDPGLALLPHAVATLAYRAGKAVRGAPLEFADFAGAASAAGRTPIQILAHMGDLFDWALALADGHPQWHNSAPLPWDREVARFFAALAAFDRRLATGARLEHPAEHLFQGPIADALTHTGQFAMLRRMAGCPMKARITSRRTSRPASWGSNNPLRA